MSLSGHVSDVTREVNGVAEWVLSSPVTVTFAMMMVVFLIVFVASHVNSNYSWVDRSWSIVPVLYTWVMVGYSMRSASTTPRLLNVATLFAVLITAWGVRMTYNFVRRGGYTRGGEDYRWEHVHSWRLFARRPWLWLLFNMVVISFFQTWLLWAITLPVVSLPTTSVTAKDAILASTFLVLLVLETICDNQQWRFQNAKRRSHSGTLAYGFCITGVFGHSRHLNVFCEGCMWATVALAAFCQQNSLQWWQWVGCVTLELLTLFSTSMITEKLSLRKYPGYAVYQSTTPMFLPSITSTTARTIFLLEKKKKGTPRKEVRKD